MEAKTRLTILPILASLLLAVGCSGGGKRPDAGAAGVYGPVPPAETSVGGAAEPGAEIAGPGRDASLYGPTQVQVYPVVLVLGPGLARGYAHVGVLRAFHEAKIPIGAVIGTDMGALVAAVFATSKTINEFEWKLLRFDEDVFLGSGLLNLTSIFSRTRSSSALESELRRAFGDRTLQDAEIPLRVGIHSASQRGFWLESGGQIASLMRVALAEPKLYDPSNWLGAEAWSASNTRPYPIKEARALSMGPVVVVDLLESEIPYELSDNEDKEFRLELTRARKAAASELNRADLVIRPDLSNVGFLDYGERTNIIFQGKAATKANLRELRQLVGLPADED